MMKFPKLPEYKFYWRALQFEPIPFSGERITLGAIVKGEDNALIAAKLFSKSKLNTLFGKNLSERVSDALTFALESADNFYSKNDIRDQWKLPVEGFSLSLERESRANDIEDSLMQASKQCSIFSVFWEYDSKPEQAVAEIEPSINPSSWRKDIYHQVDLLRSELKGCFNKETRLSGSGVPFKFGFISASYAAHFDAVRVTPKSNFLLRVQSKLWQLDQLRASNHELFKPKTVELVLYTPSVQSSDSLITELTMEIQEEADRKGIKLFTSNSASQAAKHIINQSAA